MDYVNRDVDNGVELAFHQGDIAYADGDPRVWDTFMDGIEPYASRVPYMVKIAAMWHQYCPAYICSRSIASWSVSIAFHLSNSRQSQVPCSRGVDCDQSVPLAML